MGRIAYKDYRWLATNGVISDVKFQPPNDKDYYFYISERSIVLRFFSRQLREDEPLGEILSTEGVKVGEIPAFKHPDFVSNGCDYESQVAWVRSVSREGVLLVVYCANPQDFRIRLNLDTLEYSDPEFSVR